MKHIYACCTSVLGPHDTLLYNFNLNLGDTLKQCDLLPSNVYTIASIDSILIGISYRKSYIININGLTVFPPINIIEGIGSTEGLFDDMYIPFEGGTNLTCFSQNGNTLWPDSAVGSCALYYLGVPSVKQEDISISVFPNPSQGIFTITLINPTGIAGSQTIEIFNALGEQVLNEPLLSAQGDNTVNLSNQPSGVYLYRVITETGELVGQGKLIIQK